MKLSKKVASAALASLLALSMVTSAFAAETASPGTGAKKETKTNVGVDAADESTVALVDTDEDGSAAVTRVDNEKTVTIGETLLVGGASYKVTTIETGAFKKAKSTETVKIAAKKVAIKENAFKGTKKLKAIYLSSTTVKELTIEAKAFAGVKKTVKIYVKAKNKKELKKIRKKLKNAGFKGKVVQAK